MDYIWQHLPDRCLIAEELKHSKSNRRRNYHQKMRRSSTDSQPEYSSHWSPFSTFPPSYATFMYDENLPMWTGAAKIWGVHTTWMRQNPEALMMFRAERIPGRAPFVVGRVCSPLGECPLSGIWRWHNYIYGNTWKIRTEILENERRCDEGSRWINTHVNTESQLLAYSEEFGYTHTLSSYLGLMIYKDSWTGWGNCPQA